MMTAQRVRLFLFAGLLLSLVAPSPASVFQTGGPLAGAPLTAEELAQGYRSGRVLAKLRPGAEVDLGFTALDLADDRVGVRARRIYRHLPGQVLLEFDPARPVKQVIRELMDSGRYEFVEPDRLLHALRTPNDPDYGDSWSLHNTGQDGGLNDADIDAPEAWELRTSAGDVVVAVIDSGLRQTHSDLVGNLWVNDGETAGNGRDDDGNGYIDDVHGINAITESAQVTDPEDDEGHGTHVAGIIGAVGNNGRGISGVAWDVQLMILKFLPESGSGSTSDAIECIDYAIAHGADIINASYGSESSSSSELAAIRRARDAGIIFVAAAGNEALDTDTGRAYPASYALANVVSVAATTRTDGLATFSNRGSGTVDLGAPGEAIYSTTFDNNNAYGLKSGTSMAAPHVTGALALMRAQFPGDNYRQLINRLLRTVDPAPALAGRAQTAGRLNLNQALRSTSNRPFNDDFATRGLIAGANVRVRSSNAGATTETGEPVHADSAGGRSLWWEWTAVTTGRVIFDTEGSEYDTLLAVYAGTSFTNLTRLAANDDSGSGNTSRITLEVNEGDTFQIAVDGQGGSSGFTALRIGSVPTNDNFESAISVEGRTVYYQGNNRNASRQSGEPEHGGDGDLSVWFRWVAPSSETYQMAVFATEFDTVGAVYTGSSINDLTLIAENDDSASDNTDALVTFTATEGQTYYFAVDAFGTDSEGGAYTLTVNPSLWQAPVTDEITGSPAVDPNGTIYIGALDGYLYAFNANGTRRWRYLVAGDEDEITIDTAAPAVSPEGLVYVGTTEGVLHAVSRAGTQRWSFEATSAILSTPALAEDGTIYFRDDTTLYALTPDGSQKWTHPLSGGTYSSPVVATDGTVYVGATDGNFYAVSPDGDLEWTFEAEGDIYSSPALAADGTIYFATLGGRLYALNPDGSREWALTLGNGQDVSSSPVLGPDGTLYVASYDSRLYAVSPTGSVRWTYTMGDETRASSPAVDADGTIYIGSYDGAVHAVSEEGDLIITYPTAGRIRSSMTLANGRLYFGSADAKLYAFAAADPAASPWPQFQHNAQHDGRASEEVPDGEPPPAEGPAGAVNLSTRAPVSGDDTTVVAGFSVLDGESDFLIRAVGPGLEEFGVTNAHPDPALQLFQSGAEAPFAENDNWGDDEAVAEAAEAAGAFALPEGSLDAALVETLGSGSYTVAVGGAGSGEALVEVYRLAETGAGLLVSQATLAELTGDEPTIAGFVVRGSARRVLIRVAGPALADQDVDGAVEDPRLTVFNADGQPIAANGDWGDADDITEATASAGASAFADDSADAALVATLQPGAYTVWAETESGEGGTALIEVYVLED